MKDLFKNKSLKFHRLMGAWVYTSYCHAFKLNIDPETARAVSALSWHSGTITRSLYPHDVKESRLEQSFASSDEDAVLGQFLVRMWERPDIQSHVDLWWSLMYDKLKKKSGWKIMERDIRSVSLQIDCNSSIIVFSLGDSSNYITFFEAL